MPDSSFEPSDYSWCTKNNANNANKFPECEKWFEYAEEKCGTSPFWENGTDGTRDHTGITWKETHPAFKNWNDFNEKITTDEYNKCIVSGKIFDEGKKWQWCEIETHLNEDDSCNPPPSPLEFDLQLTTNSATPITTTPITTTTNSSTTSASGP